jgi:fatty acid amide hydrolase 2
MTDIFQASVQDIAAAILKGELSSQSAVSDSIGRCQQVNGVINAIVKDRYADALKEARAADKKIAKARANGSLEDLARKQPLLGVPCSVKESIQMKGMPNTAGLVNRKHVSIETDSPTVAALRQAGAVVLGVTNTSESCMWMESFNKVYGLSRNPYDPSRTVGGSSGGEGAIIGSGAVPFGIGSDVGGSIRMPAFFNGIFAHKCSPGLVPNGGQFPQATGQIDRYLSTGPMCRRATDLEMLTRIMAGKTQSQLKPVGDVDISKLRVLRFAKERAVRPDADQLRAVDKTVAALQARGARLQTVDFPLMSKAFDLWSAMLASAGSEKVFADHLFGSRNPLYPLREFLRLATFRSDNTLPLVGLSLLEHLPDVLPRRQRRLLDQAQTLRAQLRDALGEDGILVTVPYPTPAPKHYVPLIPPFKFVNCAIFNAMSLAATSVPTGLNADGVPTGVQVVANEGFDHLGIASAVALEQDLGGWVAPRV